MGHKVTVEKIDWDGIADELESIEKHKTWSSTLKRFHIVGGVLAIAFLFLGTSIGIMISADTPSGFPTVIEPGSLVSEADYVIFADGSNYYAKNGTTGAIAYFGTNALTLFNSVIGQLPHGGMIFAHEGVYTFASPGLVITTSSITINGESKNIPFGNIPPHPVVPYDQPYGTRLTGNVKVEADDCELNNLAIIGKLYYSSTVDFSNVATFCNANNIYVYGGMEINGLLGATASQVPYNIAITNSYISGISPTNALNMTSATASISHVFFTNSVLVQYSAGSLIWVSGYVSDVAFTNTVLDTSSGTTILNLTGGGDEWAYHFNGCNIEINGVATQVLVNIGSAAQNSLIGVSWMDCWISHANLFRYIVRDAIITNGFASHNVIFTRLHYDYSILRFYGGDVNPQVNVQFVDCLFYQTMTIEQVHGEYVGAFINCRGINPYGLMATPFSGVNDDWKVISIGSSYTGSATPPASKNITIRDTAVLISASGGSGLSITIYDRSGNAVVSAAASLTGYYVPIGFKINFGAFSGEPTITVVGV